MLHDGKTSTFQLLPCNDPLGFPELVSLHALSDMLSRGGLPPRSHLRPADEARIAAFFTLQELLHILTEFQRAQLQGAHCHLTVSENGRSPGRITIDVAIVTGIEARIAA